MDNNNAEVIFKTRSPFDRRMYSEDRRFFLNQNLDHIPERRVNMINRRTHRDRRSWRSKIINAFLGRCSLIFTRMPFGK
jgi:hypothetical protein